MRKESSIVIYIALHIALVILSFVNIIVYIATQNLKYGIVAIFVFLLALYTLILVFPDVVKEKLRGDNR